MFQLEARNAAKYASKYNFLKQNAQQWPKAKPTKLFINSRVGIFSLRKSQIILFYFQWSNKDKGKGTHLLWLFSQVELFKGYIAKTTMQETDTQVVTHEKRQPTWISVKIYSILKYIYIYFLRGALWIYNNSHKGFWSNYQSTNSIASQTYPDLDKADKINTTGHATAKGNCKQSFQNKSLQALY